MSNKTTSKAMERMAIDAGYWFARSGTVASGVWIVGRGTGADAERKNAQYGNRADTRKAMVAWFESTYSAEA